MNFNGKIKSELTLSDVEEDENNDSNVYSAITVRHCLKCFTGIISFNPQLLWDKDTIITHFKYILNLLLAASLFPLPSKTT